MRTISLLSLAVVLTLGGGCKKKQPSQEFTEASSAFASLYGAKLDDAYVDPRMEDVLSQLRRVPSDSTDAAAAAELIGRIEAGKAKLIAARQAREDAKAQLLKTEVVPFRPTTSTPPPANTPPPVEEVKDAGPNVPIAPRTGMTAADFQKHFGDCFEFGPTITLQGAGAGAADSRFLRDLNRCKDKLPGYEAKYVLFQNGVLINLVNKSDIQTVTLSVDGGIFDGGR